MSYQINGFGKYPEQLGTVLSQEEIFKKDDIKLANGLEAKIDNGQLIIKKPEVAKHVFKKLVKFGDINEEVKNLQIKLVDLGYFNETIDGVFGFKTMIATKLFQKRNKLDVTGKIDAKTFNKLYNPTKEVQESNIVVEKKTSNKKKLIIGGIGILGAYFMIKE